MTDLSSESHFKKGHELSVKPRGSPYSVRKTHSPTISLENDLHCNSNRKSPKSSTIRLLPHDQVSSLPTLSSGGYEKINSMKYSNCLSYSGLPQRRKLPLNAYEHINKFSPISKPIAGKDILKNKDPKCPNRSSIKPSSPHLNEQCCSPKKQILKLDFEVNVNHIAFMFKGK